MSGVNGPEESAELAELRASVAALRAQLESRFRVGARRELPATRPVRRGIDWMELYTRLRRRIALIGMEEHSAETDEFGLDAAYLRQLRPLFDFLYDRWWRIEVTGIEAVPADGPVLFIANHSGVLPYDGLMLAHAVEREHPSHRRPRFLVEDWLVGLPFAQPLVARLGGVRACQENARRLLETGSAVIAFPEGQKGALKPFGERYRLQRFGRGGFVSLAIARRARLVPVAVVGAEQIHPLLYRPPLVEQLLGFPLAVTPTFPWLGPLGLVPLPARWRIRFGEPLDFGHVDAARAEDPLYVNRTREQVRGAVQELLDRELRGASG